MSYMNNSEVETDYIMTLLKKHFPKYRINNASERTKYELIKLMNLCEVIPNLIIYIRRNEKNDDFFKFSNDIQGFKNISSAFYSKKGDMCFTTEGREIAESKILCFKRAIEDSHECVICYKNTDIEMKYCSGCGSACCNKCILTMIKTKPNDDIIYCPICRAGVICTI